SRRRARTRPGVRLVKPDLVLVPPHRRARGQVVARHHLIVAALLLGIDMAPVDREGRPARSDRLAPPLDQLRPGPVGVDPHTMYHAVALRPPKAGPAAVHIRRSGVRRGGICATLLWSLRGGWRWRRNRRLIAGLGCSLVFFWLGCRCGRRRRLVVG